MYGEIPTRIILNEVKPPPEIKLMKLPKSDFSSRLSIASLKVAASPSGTGIWASMRYAIKILKIINRRLRMSLFLKDLKIVLKCIKTF